MAEEYVKVSGKSVEDALLEASILLGTPSDNIEYKVLEHETKGFLGFGARKAVIEVRKKKTDEDIVKEVFGTDDAEAKKKPKEKKAEKKPEVKAEKQAEKKAEKKAEKAEKKAEKPEKAEKAEKTEKAEKAEKTEKKAENKPEKKAEKAEKKSEKKAEKKAEKEEAKAIKEVKEKTPREAPDPEEVMRRSEEFLSGMFRSMDMDVQIEQTMENDVLSINLTGDDMGVLIGKRGQTLDSVQYLVSLVVNRGNASYVRVKVDTENYRERRKATLENLAKNIAFKVKKTRKSVYLDPMNPYERRIIHSALQSDPYVTTHSEGEEPNRKVVVTLKKRDKIEYDPEQEEMDSFEE